MIGSRNYISRSYQLIYLLGFSVLVYLFYFQFNVRLDYSNCELCDGHQYQKLYDYFKLGESYQMRHPYFLRTLIPYLSSLVPNLDIGVSFDVINFLFFILSVIVITKLWQHLNIDFVYQCIGIFWLVIHWTGIVRYNLFDNLTVDVPVYLFQAWLLLLFLKRKHYWLYLLLPLAMIQKESILSVVVILAFSSLYFDRGAQRKQAIMHLGLSLAVAILFQKIVVYLLPEQLDSKSSIGALLWHGRWALQDPTRFIRWFAAFGSAYGVLPFLVLVLFRLQRLTDKTYSTILVLCLMYGAFGILAGEDMTRILFLGFPFIMTLILMEMKSINPWLLALGIALSFVSLRIYPFAIGSDWAVDYAPLAYVYQWALYFLVATIFFVGTLIWKKSFLRKG
ncbi:MAG: hypothetical protein OCD76_00190 [Reichenbachiella sp.]